MAYIPFDIGHYSEQNHKAQDCKFVPSPMLNNLGRKADTLFQDSGFIKEQPVMTDEELPAGLYLRLFQGFTEY